MKKTTKKPLTIATICTGGGIYEQGAIAAGLTPIWGVEINPKVADLYQLNYPDSEIVVSDVCAIDWSNLPKPDFLHASPSCRHFSAANTKTEAAKDIEVAKAVAKAIAHFLPEIFTLENVPAYQHSASWSVILDLLEKIGYSISYQVHQLKLWGIPQKKRNRFIAIASLNQQAPLLITPNRTKHWHEEIKDLIPDLKPSTLTKTQENKLTAKTQRAIATGETVLLKRNQIRDYTPSAYQSDPYCWSITATLATDQNENNRTRFADLVTPDGIFSLNIRCLARIQTIPDSYKLSGITAIDGLVVGDGVPPYFVEQMWGQIVELRSTSAKNVHNCGHFDIAKLAELEEIIEKYAGHDVEFYRLGSALLKIKSDKLYKQSGYKSFRLYCSVRFGLGRTYVDNLIKAVPIYESVKNVANNQITEAHCRSLGKIKDPEMRSQVLREVAQKGRITSKEIEREYHAMRLQVVNSRLKPQLPEVAQVIRLTSNFDPILKKHNGYWGVVTDVNEFTCEARVLGAKISPLHPQDFIILDHADSDLAIALLDRLEAILKFKCTNDLVKIVCEAIATRPYPILEEIDATVLLAIEYQERSNNKIKYGRSSCAIGLDTPASKLLNVALLGDS
jgi:site-specific DNA-cytosine methylase